MNLIALDQLEQGGITDANGNNADGMTKRVRTLYIPIQSDLTYKVITVSPIVIRYIHYYDKNRIWISGTSCNTTGQKIITTPVNSAFLRIAFQRTNANLDITPQEAADEGKVTLTWDLNGEAESLQLISNETKIKSNGQIITGNFLENYEIAGIRNKGVVYSNNFIEY